MEAPQDLSSDQYLDLAEFRRQIRRFLHFSEMTAKEHGLEAQQHQLLLAVHGLPEDVKPTIREIASRLFIQHHSAVELINRLEHTGAIARHPGPDDKREVWVLSVANSGSAHPGALINEENSPIIFSCLPHERTSEVGRRNQSRIRYQERALRGKGRWADALVLRALIEQMAPL